MPVHPHHIRTATDLGLVLRERRRALGLSQQALADRVGVSRPWIVEVEGGKPRAEVGLLLRAMRALGLQLSLEPSESREVDAEAEEWSHATIDDIHAIIEKAKGNDR